MEGRGWPWKKKSSDKTEKQVVGNESTNVSSLSYLASLENQDKCKNSNYVQITMDSYTHMSKMEAQVKELKEELIVAHSEIKSKEGLILQHAKVAEEAVSGWEKADGEALVLKRQLESVTLLKLTAEDRASHLDDALKECTRQIRIVKEESEHKLQDMILCKTIQWDKIKTDLEKKIDELIQVLNRTTSDNATLTRSLQERSESIVKIKEEKSKVEAQVEKLKSNINLAEKEISSLKYDVHVALKEVEIRNEEKNMSLKSAEIANKQNLEGVKKIVKLEGECQRLKGLLKKKLPGPVAMAQMKLEVDEFTETHKLEECKRENVNLTKRVVQMEEEIQTLRELLATRNNELQVSRNVSAKTLGKLKILEGFNHHYPTSVTSVSEDGYDEEGSSSATSIDSHKVRKVLKANRLELMDDFLEIEKFAADDSNILLQHVLLSDNSEKEVEECEDHRVEQLKLEKENIALELEEKEKIILKLRSELASSEDFQSLAETQLKCVTESYKSLELHAKDLEAKVRSLEEEIERVKMDYSKEKCGHEETLTTCKDLQEKLQRNETCKKYSSTISQSKLQPNEEKDVSSATEKLAACQETIHLLSQQLQSLQPPSNHIPKSQSSTQDDRIIEPSHSFREIVNPTVHAIIKSNSVSSSSREDNEKHARGLGRFFSSKSKNNGR